MSIFNKFFNRSREKKDKLRNYQDEDQIVETVKQRKLSHNERALLKSLQEEKEKYIKEALYWDTKKRQIDDKLHARDSMKFNSEMFQNESILKEKRNFLRGGWNDF